MPSSVVRSAASTIRSVQPYGGGGASLARHGHVPWPGRLRPQAPGCGGAAMAEDGAAAAREDDRAPLTPHREVGTPDRVDAAVLPKQPLLLQAVLDGAASQARRP